MIIDKNAHLRILFQIADHLIDPQKLAAVDKQHIGLCLAQSLVDADKTLQLPVQLQGPFIIQPGHRDIIFILIGARMLYIGSLPVGIKRLQ